MVVSFPMREVFVEIVSGDLDHVEFLLYLVYGERLGFAFRSAIFESLVDAKQITKECSNFQLIEQLGLQHFVQVLHPGGSYSTADETRHDSRETELIPNLLDLLVDVSADNLGLYCLHDVVVDGRNGLADGPAKQIQNGFLLQLLARVLLQELHHVKPIHVALVLQIMHLLVHFQTQAQGARVWGDNRAGCGPSSHRLDEQLIRFEVV